MGMWLARRDDWPLLGELFLQDWVVAVASYGSINIGIFPWVAMAGTLRFLEPDWPKRALRATKRFGLKILEMLAPAHG